MQQENPTLNPVLGRGGAIALALALAGVVALAGTARADTLQVKGDTLRGRIVDLTADGVKFDPVYGKGTLVVPFADVESLESEAAVVVLHGERGESAGRLLGVEGGMLLVGDDAATAERIDVATLFHAHPEGDYDGSTLDRLHSRYRYWEASLDAGVAYVSSTTDTASAAVGFRIERSKAPTRLLAEGTFRYATEDQQGQQRTTTENILAGLVRGEYDLTERTYGYAQTKARYDEDASLSLRIVPGAGLGVRIFRSDTATLSADAGVAYVYEDYFGDTPIPGAAPGINESRGSLDYVTAAFGAETVVELPLDATFRARGEYLPAVDDWMYKYLLKGTASLEFPLLEWLSFKFTATDEYNNTPAEGADRNRAAITAGLSLRF